ncbi:unnamed protein product [Clavelina lepadiformis]|uniref:Uncharacterized protein n=1 Tax=Clavelina lepadiformis TaxID=159417 RepID=A0ABP0FWR3_CLALP
MWGNYFNPARKISFVRGNTGIDGFDDAVRFLLLDDKDMSDSEMNDLLEEQDDIDPDLDAYFSMQALLRPANTGFGTGGGWYWMYIGMNLNGFMQIPIILNTYN